MSDRSGPVEAHASPFTRVNVFFHGFLHVPTKASRAGARKGLIDNVSRTASLKLVEPAGEQSERLCRNHCWHPVGRTRPRSRRKRVGHDFLPHILLSLLFQTNGPGPMPGYAPAEASLTLTGVSPGITTMTVRNCEPDGITCNDATRTYAIAVT